MKRRNLLIAAGAAPLAAAIPFRAFAFDGPELYTGEKALYAAAEKADAIMIMTEWPEFRTPDFDRIDLAVNNKVIFDGRNWVHKNKT